MAVVLLGLAALQSTAGARTVLFVGNSFTFGGESPAVQGYRPETVTDLNHEGMGGVPALFKSFTREAGLEYDVYLETAPGMNLDFHYEQKPALIGRAWDHVIVHGYSNDQAAKHSSYVRAVIPVGQAWNRAIAEGVAAPNPYQRVGPDQINLWAADGYHASVYGYYLEALVIFGSVSGHDPRSLGPKEPGAAQLGISPARALALQRIAFETLASDRER